MIKVLLNNLFKIWQKNNILKEFGIYGTSLIDHSTKPKTESGYIKTFGCDVCYVRNNTELDGEFHLEIINTRAGQVIICPYLAMMAREDVKQSNTNCG